jgi:two-component system NtrC family sensor kinase
LSHFDEEKGAEPCEFAGGLVEWRRTEGGGGNMDGARAHIGTIAGSRRPLRRTLFGLLAAPPLCLVLAAGAILLWEPASLALKAALLAGALFASLAVGTLYALRLSRRLCAVERERDAFYQEFLRLSKVASLGEVASSIAHDLNNPLAIMHEEAGWVQDLLRQAEASPEASRAEIANSVEQIEVQIRRSREITQRLLHWARETEPKPEALDVNLLLGKTLYLLESDLQSAQVKVVKAFSPDLPLVHGSAPEVRQVLLNLMKNAVDAMKGSGGTLTLSTAKGPSEVRISVTDTGPGIDAEQVERVFEPFFSTKPEGEGTGLGLPISRWIVGRLGGRIEVESQPGQGSTFRVVLPAGVRDGAADLGGERK